MSGQVRRRQPGPVSRSARALGARLSSVGTDPDAPLRQGIYRSPLRDERVAAVLGAGLGVLFVTCFATGLFSHLHQHPLAWLPVPARPAGLYRVTQGVHVASGIASLPLLLAKLWVVWPRFVSVPPVRGLRHLVERVGLLPLVGGGLFLIGSGIANIAQWYPWRFAFPAAHYWTAWVTVGALVAHVGATWLVARRSLRRARGAGEPSVVGEGAAAVGEGAAVVGEGAAAVGEGAAVVGPAAVVVGRNPGGLGRRGFLAAVGASAAALTLTTVGQTVLPLRRLALLAPRDPAVGPQGRPVNRSAANAGVETALASPAYRLTVEGRVGRPLSLDVDALMAMSTREATLPIACVEGWSYSARWRGLPVRDLLALAGAPPGASARVESLEEVGASRSSFLDVAQAHDPDTLLATHLDGELLAPDHGYPLRLIGPGRPGVNQTKWVTRLVVL